MSPVLAMEWLFQHESDPDIDEPLVLGARGGRTQRRRKEFEPNPRVRNSMCKNYDNNDQGYLLTQWPLESYQIKLNKTKSNVTFLQKLGENQSTWEKSSWSRVQNQQSQPSFGSNWGSDTHHIGGRRVVSPLCQTHS